MSMSNATDELLVEYEDGHLGEVKLCDIRMGANNDGD